MLFEQILRKRVVRFVENSLLCNFQPNQNFQEFRILLHLLYDFRHTYVPVLPELLIEYLESPTPYIMGVLSTVRIRCTDLDAVVVDLDVGAVYVPPSITIPVIPQPFHQQLISSLQMVRIFLKH